MFQSDTPQIFSLLLQKVIHWLGVCDFPPWWLAYPILDHIHNCFRCFICILPVRFLIFSVLFFWAFWAWLTQFCFFYLFLLSTPLRIQNVLIFCVDGQLLIADSQGFVSSITGASFTSHFYFQQNSSFIVQFVFKVQKRFLFQSSKNILFQSSGGAAPRPR